MKIRTIFLGILFLSLGEIRADDTLSPPADPIEVFQCQGIVGLDLSGSGNNEQIALFIINNNCAAGFNVSFKFANFCKFKCGTTREIPMTAVVLDKVSGTLGAGLTGPIDEDVLHNLSGDEYVWNAGVAPTSKTVNYIVELRASWDFPAGILAGFYSEIITVVISKCL